MGQIHYLFKEKLPNYTSIPIIFINSLYSLKKLEYILSHYLIISYQISRQIHVNHTRYALYACIQCDSHVFGIPDMRVKNESGERDGREANDICLCQINANPL